MNGWSAKVSPPLRHLRPHHRPGVQPDGTHEWKDEDDYAHGRQLGLVTDTQHTEIARAKDQAFAMFEQRTGPFDEKWLSWRRDPAWPLPVLPDNATTVPAAV
jgi:hypothetical protein